MNGFVLEGEPFLFTALKEFTGRIAVAHRTLQFLGVFANVFTIRRNIGRNEKATRRSLEFLHGFKLDSEKSAIFSWSQNGVAKIDREFYFVYMPNYMPDGDQIIRSCRHDRERI